MTAKDDADDGRRGDVEAPEQAQTTGPDGDDNENPVKPTTANGNTSTEHDSENDNDDNGDDDGLPLPTEVATIRETFSFGDSSTFGRRNVCLFFGFIFAVISGVVYPSLIFFFAQVLEDLSAPTSDGDFLKVIRELCFIFLIIGVIVLCSMTGMNACFELAAADMTASLKTSWFDALLRQDMAYYDAKSKEMAGTSTTISSASKKYRRGVGRKLAGGIQFTITAVVALAYAFYSSWRTSLVIMTTLPCLGLSADFLVKTNQKQSARANKAYAEAGSVVHETVSAIRTVLSLNACQVVLQKYCEATARTCKTASRFTAVVGLANGSVMFSFMLSYLVLTLYGAYLLYSQVEDDGCDPSGAMPDNDTCGPSGMDVFAALMGVYFAGGGMPQISSAVEAFQAARAACHPALVVMHRKIGEDGEDGDDAEQEEGKKGGGNNSMDDDGTAKNGKKKPTKAQRHRSSVVLPKYTIDSSSDEGLKPSSVEGRIVFNDVSFKYPTRDEQIFKAFNLTIQPGTTCAIVGPSGGGKSTVVWLLERFYDVLAGSITLDGNDLRDLNVRWLRSNIGVVGQEPVLFAGSVRDNIALGSDDVTQDQIEDAARMANAHDFISGFVNGYDTSVGDLGNQISGGQKQRIAIARVLLKNPKILLLDEATSALDSESERAVQKALDALLEDQNRTTLIIAHRLSTIKHADMIAVVNDGGVAETGTHEELMASESSLYRKLVEAQSAPPKRHSEEELAILRRASSLRASDHGGNGIAEDETLQLQFKNVSFSYPTRPGNVIFRTLNLSVRKGETLAIVGPSGGGKSTVFSLIERFYDTVGGSVSFDGVDVKELNVGWLRSQLGLVSQEPTLFNATVAENIAYGCDDDVTHDQIVEAAKQANAHDFVSSWPDGYDTNVGAKGSQVSGGQKQRIAIARCVLRRPRVLLLDEATAALDSKSEQLVQQALDKLMSSKSQTTIVIAHRLSTIRDADRIAYIADGRVKEIGSHDELMAKPNGRYRRLQELQALGNATSAEEAASHMEKTGHFDALDEEPAITDDTATSDGPKDEEKATIEKKNSKRARLFAKDDIGLLFIGAVGAALAGVVFPGWGVLSGYMTDLLYRPVLFCDPDDPASVPDGFGSCQDYWDDEADEMRDLSFKISYGWIATMFCALIGNCLVFFGFGSSSERINKRVRDAAFRALIRQEVEFFDKRNIGAITSQLEDDAALVHSFSGEPIRQVIVSLSSVLIGIIISFVFMWPFALLSMAILPFMAIGAEIEMRTYFGEDEGDDAKEDGSSAGGIVVETLLNMRTVASLSLEEERSKEYKVALRHEEPELIKTSLIVGSATGIGFFFQTAGMALMFWWGGWLLVNYSDSFSFKDFNISMWSLFLGLYGLTMATEGATNRDKAKEAADRIFSLIDRESQIDPFSDAGKKLE